MGQKTTAGKLEVITRRRERVIAAASRCFRQQGFYHTAMAEIAADCGLSVGQIYRYFVNKDALIEAVVRDFMAKKILQSIALTYPLETMAAKLAPRRATDVADQAREDDGLLLEVWKEARRSENIAKIVQTAEREWRDRLRQTLLTRFTFLSEEAAQARVEIIVVLCEGSYICRKTLAHADQGVLRPLYQHIIDGLFTLGQVGHNE